MASVITQTEIVNGYEVARIWDKETGFKVRVLFPDKEQFDQYFYHSEASQKAGFRYHKNKLK